MELKGLCSGLHYPLSWSNGSAVREAKEVLSLQMSRGHGKEIPFSYTHTHIILSKVIQVYEERREEEGEKVKHEENSQNYPFGHIFKKSAPPLSSAWSLLLVHVRFTPS